MIFHGHCYCRKMAKITVISIFFQFCFSQLQMIINCYLEKKSNPKVKIKALRKKEFLNFIFLLNQSTVLKKMATDTFTHNS